jgi:hypothetical protein
MMTEPELPETDPELEATIKDLFYRMERAKEGSAEHRLIMRALEGLLVYELAQPILEDCGLFMNHRRVDPKSQPAKVLPLQRLRSSTSESRP